MSRRSITKHSVTDSIMERFIEMGLLCRNLPHIYPPQIAEIVNPTKKVPWGRINAPMISLIPDARADLLAPKTMPIAAADINPKSNCIPAIGIAKTSANKILRTMRIASPTISRVDIAVFIVLPFFFYTFEKHDNIIKSSFSKEQDMKVGFLTLGCKVNQYETRAVAEKFLNKGYEVTNDATDIDIAVINSCSVTGMAEKKVRQAIRKMRRENPDSVIAVMGCYPQREGGISLKSLGSNVIIGNESKLGIVEKVENFLKERASIIDVTDINRCAVFEDMQATCDIDGRKRAYIKIQDGCDRYCTYCIIAHVRGRVRSKEADNIYEEAKELVENGYREIVLTGINTALYGKDFHRGIGKSMADVINKIATIPEDFRVRIGSLEPTVVNKEYINLIKNLPKLCHHAHLSVQSGSNNVLRAMGRNYTREEYIDIVNMLRGVDGNYGISTDIIVGFPGESEKDFEQSLMLVEEIPFTKVHIFRYSEREGTPAVNFKGKIKEEIKMRRMKQLEETAKKSMEKFHALNIGDRRGVIFETNEESVYTGYTDNYIKVRYKVPCDEGKNIDNSLEKGDIINSELLKDCMDYMTCKIGQTK